MTNYRPPWHYDALSIFEDLKRQGYTLREIANIGDHINFLAEDEEEDEEREEIK